MSTIDTSVSGKAVSIDLPNSQYDAQIGILESKQELTVFGVPVTVYKTRVYNHEAKEEAFIYLRSYEFWDPEKGI